jgi:hypothetical protein
MGGKTPKIHNLGSPKKNSSMHVQIMGGGAPPPPDMH